MNVYCPGHSGVGLDKNAARIRETSSAAGGGRDWLPVRWLQPNRDACVGGISKDAPSSHRWPRVGAVVESRVPAASFAVDARCTNVGDNVG